jgi:hypothetical protein
LLGSKLAVCLPAAAHASNSSSSSTACIRAPCYHITPFLTLHFVHNHSHLLYAWAE